MKCKQFVPLVVIFLGLPLFAQAQSLSGRLTSSFYALERSDTTNVNDLQARGYQGFMVDFRARNLLIRSYGQVDGDFKNPLVDDAKVRLYNLYLEWRNIGNLVNLRLGRQPIFGGAAVGTIDGGQIDIRATRWLRLKGFGGGLLPASQEIKLIDDLDKNFLAGGQVILQPGFNFDASVSYYKKNQTRPGFNTLRADSVGTVSTQFMQPGAEAFQFAALDVSWRPASGTFIYGRGDYDFYSEELSRAELSVRSELGSALTLNGAYTFRTPNMPWNSIFSVFDIQDNHEVEAGLYYRTGATIALYANAAGIFYDGDESARFTFGTNFPHGGLNYVMRRGYAGELDGVNASFYHGFARGLLTPSLQLSWASYSLTDGGERQDLFSGAAGMLVRPHRSFSVDGQLQLLHNRFYSNDVRFLLRLQYWFFTLFSQTQ